MLNRLGRRRGADTRLVAAALGAVTGIRSTAGMTALTHGGRGGRGLERLFARGTELLASGELIADKAIALPARTETTPLLARAVLGGAAAGLFARRRGAGLVASVAIGAGTAVVSAFAATTLRRTITTRTRVPDAVVGLAEDAVVVAGSAWIINQSDRG